MEWVDQALTLIYVKGDEKNKKIEYGGSTFILINVVPNEEHLIYTKNMNINSLTNQKNNKEDASPIKNNS